MSHKSLLLFVLVVLIVDIPYECDAQAVAVGVSRQKGDARRGGSDSPRSALRTKQLGPVTVATSLTPTEPIIGDQLTLHITVDAPADVEVLMPEFGEALDRYRIVDFVPRKKVNSDGSTTYSQKYTIQPYQSGEQSIPPILVEFVDNRPGKKPSPDDLDAYEILTDRIDFTVKSVLPAGASNELKPPLGELELKTESPINGRSWLLAIVIGAGVVVGIIALVLAKKWKNQVIRRNAYEIARTRLDQLMARPLPETVEAVESFFIEISAIVRRYLENRYELRAPDLTTEEFLSLAGQGDNLSRDHQALLQEFLRQADMVKFAGVSVSPDDIKRSTDLASRFLDETSQDAPMIEVSDDTDTPEVAHV